jgi:hypothetical protein
MHKQQIEFIKAMTAKIEAMVIANEQLLANSANLVAWSNAPERVYKEEK